MKIVGEDTNDAGQHTFLLEKSDTTGTLIVATEFRPGRYRLRYLLTDRTVTARDALVVFRALDNR